MTRWLGALNLGVVALGIFFAVALGRELADNRPLPRVPQAQPAPAVTAAPVGAGLVAPRANYSANLDSSAYGIIASGNIFDPSRSAASATAGLPGKRPLLYGVVAGAGVESRAYVADPVTKLVRGYLIGDTVGGWRLDQIREDRAVFVGPDHERLDVLLRDPTKPMPAVVASVVAPVAVGAPAAELVAPPAAPARPLGQPAPAASAAEKIGEAVPRGIGAIPPQLFRPARAQPTPPDAIADEHK